MRSDLTHLPLQKRRALARVVACIQAQFSKYFMQSTMPWKQQARIEQIILFGSYARGDWVDEPGTDKGYRSDIDLLILVNDSKLTEPDGVWSAIEDDLLAHQKARPLQPDVNFIVHTSRDMQSMLDKGRFFFVDIWEEGRVLYAAENARILTAPQRPLPEDVRLAEARLHFEEWFPNIEQFFRQYSLALSEGWLKNAAFQLHQATESAYHCFLLVRTNYSPRTHNIKHLRSLAEGIDPRLTAVWPRATRPERKPFNKLKDAYVQARYSKHYKITADELADLGVRVKSLQVLIKAACDETLAARS